LVAFCQLRQRCFGSDRCFRMIRGQLKRAKSKQSDNEESEFRNVRFHSCNALLVSNTPRRIAQFERTINGRDSPLRCSEPEWRIAPQHGVPAKSFRAL
jgi:hypothetical protein